MRRTTFLLTLAIGFGAMGGTAMAAPADLEEGARVFQACAACHSLEPGEHRTGPSLAGIFGRPAGTAPGFTRYSPALEASEITWSEETLDAWLADPAALIPGNRMTFPGVPDPAARADLIAYLEAATGHAAEAPRAGGRAGMMGAGEKADLRHGVGPNNRVEAISYCGDTYTVEVESGATHPFWEFNLRFKTDSSERGPQPGHPVLIPAGMMGDRAFLIFAAPDEISRFIEARCPDSRSGGRN